MGLDVIQDGGRDYKSYPTLLSSLTAGGAEDGVATLSQSIDRLGFDSAKISLIYQTTIPGVGTYKDTIVVSDSDTSGGSYTTYSTPLTAATTIDTGLTTITANADFQTNDYNVNLAGAKRYIKIATDPTMSASSADICHYCVSVTLTGPRNRPTSA